MSKLKGAVDDFLQENGYKLGYDWDNLPSLKDFDIIIESNIPVWEYRGYESERKYYGG